MPFFLVTHRSLVEAESDHEAAVKVLEKIENGGNLEFEVKFDEATVTYVVLEARKIARQPSETIEQLSSPGQQEELIVSRLRRPDRWLATIVAVFLGGLVLMTVLLGSL